METYRDGFSDPAGGETTGERVGTSLKLFQVGGIEVKVHWSFALILIWGAVSYGATTGDWVRGGIYGVLVILLLFVCVTLHEFGHAVAARRYGVAVPTITLLPIGGVAQLERMPEKPAQELVIALAGPAVNVALAVILLPVAMGVGALTGVPNAGLNPAGWVDRVAQMGPANLLYYLAGVNLLLAIFNLLPAFPMDGGRILRALLALAMPYVQATRLAVFVGRLIAVPLAIWGIFSGSILLLLIAFFVYVGGGAEREAVETRSILGRIPVARAINRESQRLYTTESVQRAVDLIMSSYQQDYAVFDLGNRFVGVLTRTRLVDALRSVGPEARIGEVMISAQQVPNVSRSMNLADVWELMNGSGSHVVAIQEEGHFVALLSLDDIAEVMHVMGAAMARSAQQLPQPPAIPASLTAASAPGRGEDTRPDRPSAEA